MGMNSRKHCTCPADARVHSVKCPWLESPVEGDVGDDGTSHNPSVYNEPYVDRSAYPKGCTCDFPNGTHRFGCALPWRQR